jgi:hypothetical protein
MELHPTPESWRVALLTAVGAIVVALSGAVVAVGFGTSTILLVGGIVVTLAALATFAPAVGTLSATVDADRRGVVVRRFGRTSNYTWDEIVDVKVIERRAAVPDGTEYHWVVPSRSAHRVAVPCLELADGRLRQLPALAAPASGPRSAAAREFAAVLERVRDLTAVPASKTAAAPTAEPLIRSA